MAWEWSHTQESYDFARDYLHEKMTPALLVEIAAEWDTHAKSAADKDNDAMPFDFDQEFYATRLVHYGKLSVDAVAEYVWGKMSAQRTCDNGGYEFWACPYGCGCHKVPASENEAEA